MTCKTKQILFSAFFKVEILFHSMETNRISPNKETRKTTFLELRDCLQPSGFLMIPSGIEVD